MLLVLPVSIHKSQKIHWLQSLGSTEHLVLALGEDVMLILLFCLSPLSIHGGGAGVLWRVVWWWRNGSNELIKVQCLVEDGSMGSHTVSVKGPRSVRHKLEDSIKGPMSGIYYTRHWDLSCAFIILDQNCSREAWLCKYVFCLYCSLCLSVT